MVRTVGWRAAAPACLLLMAGALAGCGASGDGATAADPTASDSSSAAEQPSGDQKSSKPAPPDAPDCADIWNDGARIPRGYQGCAEGDDYVARESLACSSGQRMVRFDRYYGVLGGTVHEAAEPLLHDRDFRAAIRRCRA